MGPAHSSVLNETDRKICVITFNHAEIMYRDYNMMYVVEPGQTIEVEANPDAFGLKVGIIYRCEAKKGRSSGGTLYFDKWKCKNESKLVIQEIDGASVVAEGDCCDKFGQGSLLESHSKPFILADESTRNESGGKSTPNTPGLTDRAGTDITDNITDNNTVDPLHTTDGHASQSQEDDIIDNLSQTSSITVGTTVTTKTANTASPSKNHTLNAEEKRKRDSKLLENTLLVALQATSKHNRDNGTIPEEDEFLDGGYAESAASSDGVSVVSKTGKEFTPLNNCKTLHKPGCESATLMEYHEESCALDQSHNVSLPGTPRSSEDAGREDKEVYEEVCEEVWETSSVHTTHTSNTTPVTPHTPIIQKIRNTSVYVSTPNDSLFDPQDRNNDQNSSTIAPVEVHTQPLNDKISSGNGGCCSVQ